MDKAALLNLLALARKRAEIGDAEIESQHAIITALECEGLDSAKAREILTELVTSQEVDLTEMERLLDVMDKAS